MQKTKTAMITLCGRPNVGKSSLTNALVGEKIAIVSNKPQTTRNRIYGVVTEGDTQLVLLDTPGFHKPRSRLGDYMVKVARDSIADVDLVALGQRAAGHGRDDLNHLLVKHHHPTGLGQRRGQVGVQVVGRLPPLPGLEKRHHHL